MKTSVKILLFTGLLGAGAGVFIFVTRDIRRYFRFLECIINHDYKGMINLLKHFKNQDELEMFMANCNSAIESGKWDKNIITKRFIKKFKNKFLDEHNRHRKNLSWTEQEKEIVLKKCPHINKI